MIGHLNMKNEIQNSSKDFDNLKTTRVVKSVCNKQDNNLCIEDINSLGVLSLNRKINCSNIT